MKGQSSIEFMILVSAVLFFFISLLFIIYGTIADKNKLVIDNLAVDLASAVRNELSLATTAGDGYSRNFDIPALLVGQEYEISLVDSSVYVRTTDDKHAVALPVVNVTGQIVKGDNIIKNVNGTVFLN